LIEECCRVKVDRKLVENLVLRFEILSEVISQLKLVGRLAAEVNLEIEELRLINLIHTS